MTATEAQLFQRVRLTRNQDQSIGQQGWTGIIMDYQDGSDYAQIEIDPRFAPQAFLGVALSDLEFISVDSPGR